MTDEALREGTQTASLTRYSRNMILAASSAARLDCGLRAEGPDIG